MPSVTIQGAGSVYPTLTAGTNAAIARQAAAVISNAISGAAAVTVTAGGTAPNPSSTPALLVINTNNPTNLNFPSTYPYVVAGDNSAPMTLSGGGATAQEIILGAGTVQVNTGGGSGTVVGGDGDKSINFGATTGFAVYTGAGHDTIDLRQSLASGVSTVEAGAGFNVYSNAGAVTQPGNTVLLGAGATQVRSTGSDSVTAGNGSATIQVVGNVQDTVFGGAGRLTLVNGSIASTLNFSTATTTPLSSGSVTALGGAGGGYYRGGSNGSNLLVGSLGAVTLQGAGNGDVLIAMGTSGMQLLYAGSGNETLLGSLSTTSNLFVAGSGNDVILGGSGADTFIAGTGAATITAGSGPDLFMLNANTTAGAQITITDFAPGVDYVRLLNYGGANNPASLAAAAAHLGNAGSRVTLSDGTTITFQGISTVTSNFFG